MEVTVQSSPYPITAANGGTVTVAGGRLDGIDDISVTANAIVDGGNISIRSADKMLSHPDIELGPNEKIRIIAANPLRAELVVQVASDETTDVRFAVRR